MESKTISNPFKPGAGHQPPYLAGRSAEQEEMSELLQQREITQNLTLTGLRGVGKTVLLDAFKPIALKMGWLWATNDMSEAASETDDNLAVRILTDIAIVTSPLVVEETRQIPLGFAQAERVLHRPLNFEVLRARYEQAPGLVSDKLKACLEFVWAMLPQGAISGIVFAYDEAQNLADHEEEKQFPLALLLDVFQSRLPATAPERPVTPPESGGWSKYASCR